MSGLTPSATVTVHGRGTATTKPDYAVIHFGARVVRDTPTDALRDVAAIAISVTTALNRLGVDDDDIISSPGHIDRERHWHDGVETIIGWFAHYSVQAHITDPATVYTTVLEISSIEGVTISQPSWEVAADNPAHEQARHLAIADARRRARHLADAAALDLGPIVEIQEGIVTASPVMPRRAALGAADMQAAPEHGLETVHSAVTLTIAATPQPDQDPSD